MTSVVRNIRIIGDGTNPLTSANGDAGNDLADVSITRVLAAGDIGTGAGQIGDTTSDPTLGCLAVQFTGSRVVEIDNLQLWRGTAAAHTTVFWGPVTGTAGNTVNIRTHVVYNVQTGVSSVYLIDEAAGAPGVAVADDEVRFTVCLGQSVPAVYAG